MRDIILILTSRGIMASVERNSHHKIHLNQMLIHCKFTSVKYLCTSVNKIFRLFYIIAILFHFVALDIYLSPVKQCWYFVK